MLSEHIASQIYGKFQFTPTFEHLHKGRNEGGFTRSGIAIEDKNTLIAAFVEVLKEMRLKPILLAPTGRAAKVMTQFAPSTPAHTIHKRIYRERTSGGFDSKFDLNFNREKDAVFWPEETHIHGAHSRTGFPA